MQNHSFSIKVPASTANLGPGFDSVGIALDRYLSVHVAPSDHWEAVFYGELDFLNQSGKDLITKTAEHTAELYQKKLPPSRLEIESSFPLSKGMGSSASAILAGIELADTLLGLQLTKEKKAILASSIEGHADNVVPALYGGLTISCYNGKELETVHVPDVAVEMIVAIPEENLETKHSRSSLPNLLPFNKAVEGSAISNVLVAALIKNDWEKASAMMDRDLFHEPFRSKWIPYYPELKASAVSLGCYGAAISGSGPAVVCFAPHQKGCAISEQLALIFPDMHFETVFPDRKGMVVTKKYEKRAIKQNFLIS
jgi:homoserine kinase